MSLFEYREGVTSICGLSDKEALFTMDKPTLFHLPGEDHSRAVLVSTLLHGREPSGFRAFLKEAEEKRSYLFDVYFSVGNVHAAQLKPYFNQRDVPGKEDFNRVWVDSPKTEDQRTAAEMAAFFERLPLIGFLDIHSYIAKSIPPHGVIPKMDFKTKRLIQRLSPTAFLVDMNLGSLLEKMGKRTTAVLVETGVNNSPEADAHAYTSLQNFFHAIGILEDSGELSYQTKFYDRGIQFKIKEDVSVMWATYKYKNYALTLREDLDTLNHTLVQPGRIFGWSDSLDVFTTNDLHRSVDDYFSLQNGIIRVTKKVVPNFLNTEEKIMKRGGFYFFQEV
ncbi:MAG: hypothetical protein Q8R18_04380 [bacterium]|nr:hypothetical protein [bacterium]